MDKQLIEIQTLSSQICRMDLHEAIFGDVFEAEGLETERRLAVKVTELEKMRLQVGQRAPSTAP